MNRKLSLAAAITLSLGCAGTPSLESRVQEKPVFSKKETTVPPKTIAKKASAPKPVLPTFPMAIAQGMASLTKQELDDMFDIDTAKGYHVTIEGNTLKIKEASSPFITKYAQYCIDIIKNQSPKHIDALIEKCKFWRSGWTQYLSDEDHRRPYNHVIDELLTLRKERKAYEKEQREIPGKLKVLYEKHQTINPKYASLVQAEIDTLQMKQGHAFSYSDMPELKHQIKFFIEQIKERNYQFDEPQKGWYLVVCEPIATSFQRSYFRNGAKDHHTSPVMVMEQKNRGDHILRVETKGDFKEYQMKERD